MTQYLRAYYQQSEGDDREDKALPFIASTEGVKADGFDLRADAWSLDRFQRNPLVLWAHDMWGERPPIGRAVARIEDKVLKADITFDPADEFAQTIERKYRTGFLNAVSVSWDAIDGKNHLLEISAVPIPMDPDALMERTRRGYAEIGQTLATLLDDEPRLARSDAEAIWIGTACQMARLFRPDASDAESVRLQKYRRLCRTYERLDKIPPEFLGIAELAAMDEPTRAGLFLEQEPELVPEFFQSPTIEPPVDPTQDDLARIAALFAGEAS